VRAAAVVRWLVGGPGWRRRVRRGAALLTMTTAVAACGGALGSRPTAVHARVLAQPWQRAIYVGRHPEARLAYINPHPPLFASLRLVRNGAVVTLLFARQHGLVPSSTTVRCLTVVDPRLNRQPRLFDGASYGAPPSEVARLHPPQARAVSRLVDLRRGPCPLISVRGSGAR
jgi:hypothetical protein